MQKRLNTPGTGSARRAPKFKVVVAFDGADTGSSALRTYQYVISKLGRDIQVRRKLVDFNAAQNERKLAAAARDAAQADMVIVSTREGEKLAPPIEEWMADWSGKRGSSEGALVAILKKSEQAMGGVRDQLENMARQAHMDFFSSTVAAH